jgi:hypothetical protein
MELTRRELFAVVASAAVVACGGGDDDGADPIDAPPASCLNNGTRVTISSNHGHTLEIPMADVAAGTARTYDITGDGGHAHSVMITADQMAMLAANTAVTVTSSAGGGHTHTVNVSCR